MSDTNAPVRPAKAAPLVWLAVAVVAAVVVAANVHLVYVAATSQPDCVDHRRQGEGSTAAGLYSAAQSSCSPGTARANTQPE
jgi:hypothetical protein